MSKPCINKKQASIKAVVHFKDTCKKYTLTNAVKSSAGLSIQTTKLVVGFVAVQLKNKYYAKVKIWTRMTKRKKKQSEICWLAGLGVGWMLSQQNKHDHLIMVGLVLMTSCQPCQTNTGLLIVLYIKPTEAKNWNLIIVLHILMNLKNNGTSKTKCFTPKDGVKLCIGNHCQSRQYEKSDNDVPFFL